MPPKKDSFARNTSLGAAYGSGHLGSLLPDLIDPLAVLVGGPSAGNTRCLAELFKLPATTLGIHAEAIARGLSDKNMSVRVDAVRLLGKLEPGMLANHTKSILPLLVDDYWSFRRSALEALGKLNPSMLARHAHSIAPLLTDAKASVRIAAAESLSKLEPSVRDSYKADIIMLFRDKDRSVRRAAINVLGKDEFVAWAVSDPLALLPGRDTLLHCAAHEGLVELARYLLTHNLTAVLDARNANNETPLHVAAQEGHLDVCEELLQAGALVKVKNGKKSTPQDLAEQGGHSEIVRCLSARTSLSSVRGGSGDAVWQALADTRPVIKVEWYTMRISGITGAIGTCHSLLSVTVGRSGISSCTYVLEKAVVSRVASQLASTQFKNGVYVSLWKDVVADVDTYPIHALHSHDLANNTGGRELCMRTLHEIAVDLGPYDVGTCNCHHAALAVFNACALPKAAVAGIPNAYLTWGAWLLTLIGFDVTYSESPTSQSTIASAGGPVTPVSHFSAPRVLHAGRFALTSNCESYDHHQAAPCALLSNWIYTPVGDGIEAPPLVGAQPQYIDLAQDGSLVQWAVVSCGDTIYATFRGTSDLIDVFFDLDISAHYVPEYDLRVHAGMWTALHKRDHHVVDSVIAEVRAARRSRNDWQMCRVVLCGHSLGGGYALLTALDMLHRGMQVTQVVTFGAPQVVVRDPDVLLWQKLNEIATLYVNAFDVVPRLPSCLNWVFEVLPTALALGTRFGSVRSGVDLREMLTHLLIKRKATLSKYDTAGSMLFVTTSSTTAMRVPNSQDNSHRKILGDAPETVETFIFEHHAMAEYLAIAVRLQSRSHGASDGIAQQSVELQAELSSQQPPYISRYESE
eukprot:TRINITY_DN56075_c0_g1_i1.p1 TRINITY_DN56075_c0_g1~~TRINITY_DN56075_c0_g1_i1.p1  ORF type:complete len:870 (-),score=146.02 TRINITY_DN56075_c0_g1_i1:314-2890(-)